MSDIAALAAPERATRLAALKRLVASQPRPAFQGTNTHIHTNWSFSAFASPQEAVWLAWQAGVEVFGINDHYTVDGHAEFAEACAVARLPATFSIESVAMDREAAEAGVLLNDPGNPGRVYASGKGVTRRDDPTAQAMLETLRHHQEVRNRAMTERVDERFRERLGEPGPAWADVEGQTPAGNTTERHLARAIDQRLAELAGEEAIDSRFERIVGVAPEGDAAARQNTIRSKLLKAGKPCYVDEDPEAYPALGALRRLYLHLGAIPTYPVLGNPITGGEEDVEALCERLAGWGFHALELIPHRNTDDRVAAVLAAAEARGWPVFDGTEHNTPKLDPLLTRWGSDQRFRPTFRDGALVLLGHQALRAAGEAGYITDDGTLVAGGRDRCRDAGSEVVRTVLAQPGG